MKLYIDSDSEGKKIASEWMVQEGLSERKGRQCQTGKVDGIKYLRKLTKRKGEYVGAEGKKGIPK